MELAKIKIEHPNERKLREMLEKRGMKKKNPNAPKKKGPIINTNYRKMPPRKENEQ